MQIEKTATETSKGEAALLNESRASNKRQSSIDVLKAICAFLVVCIHCPFPGEIGEYITSLSRIAVPVFFMISGFFYQNTADRHNERKQIKKVFGLVIISTVIFLLYQSFIHFFHGDLLAYWQSVFTFRNLVILIFTNDNPLAGHLWYLNAVLYVLVIVYMTDKYGLKKLLYIVSPLLLIGDLVFGKYSILLLGKSFPFILVRNFLFVGIPYFCIGRIIFDQRTNIVRKMKSAKLLVLCIILFSITTIVERYLLVSFDINPKRDHYISTTFLSVAVFIFAMVVKMKTATENSMAYKIMANIGFACSAWVYIIHPIFITLFSYFSKRLGIVDIYGYIAPVIVYASSASFVLAFKNIHSRLHR